MKSLSFHILLTAILILGVYLSFRLEGRVKREDFSLPPGSLQLWSWGNWVSSMTSVCIPTWCIVGQIGLEEFYDAGKV